MQTRKRDSPEAPIERLKANVARGLTEIFSGFEIVDRELDLGENRRVDWVGVEATGRLVLVLLVEGDGVEPVLGALDALAFVQRNRSVLAGHLQSHKLRPEVAPIVALVAESFSDRLLGRLSGLNGEMTRLFELRTVASARGEHVYLAPIQPAPARAAMLAPRGTEVFVRGLDPSLKPLAELVLKRVARIDDQLSSAASEKAITWRWNGELLCTLATVDDQLEGQAHPDGNPVRVGAAADVEAFVERALQRYVDLLGNVPRASEPQTSLESVEPHSLLSAEELEAFRQPS